MSLAPLGKVYSSPPPTTNYVMIDVPFDRVYVSINIMRSFDRIRRLESFSCKSWTEGRAPTKFPAHLIG